jgi:hypothetical protein
MTAPKVRRLEFFSSGALQLEHLQRILPASNDKIRRQCAGRQLNIDNPSAPDLDLLAFQSRQGSWRWPESAHRSLERGCRETPVEQRVLI